MVGFNKATGELIIGGISFRAHQRFEELEAALESKSCNLSLMIRNLPWETYRFLGLKGEDVSFNGTVSFKENLLSMISISQETTDKNWEEFVQNIEATKTETKSFTNKLLGAQSYAANWGSAVHSFGQKGMNVSFSVNYK